MTIARLLSKKNRDMSRSRSNADRRTIEQAGDQVSAMLFFLLPPAGRRRRRMKPQDLRYQVDNAVRGLVHLADGLRTGAFGETACEACGEPIGPGQHHVADAHDGGSFHARKRCAPVDPKRCPRMPTRVEARRELVRRVAAAREYLRRRGMTA